MHFGDSKAAYFFIYRQNDSPSLSLTNTCHFSSTYLPALLFFSYHCIFSFLRKQPFSLLFLKMEVASANSEVSFLSLLMAPETATIEEDDFYETTENFKNFLPPSSLPPSLPPLSDHDYCYYYQHANNNNNNNLHFISPPPEPYFLPPSPEFSTGLPDLLSFENFVELPPPSNMYSPLPQSQYLLSQPPPSLPQQQPPRDDYSLDSILDNYLKTSKQKRKSSSMSAPASQQQKTNRRGKLSEKIYCLGKLLPGGHRHRKNTADMLEEAKKYVLFLQAQVNSLKTMPTESRFTESRVRVKISRGIGELTKLSRQQLLRVVVNSPAAQIVMADEGWCLATAEQVELMKRIEARQKVIQQLMDSLPL